MHHLNFIAKSPDKHPTADVFFVTPNELTNLPERCFSLYITTEVSADFLDEIASSLSDKAIIVDYTKTANSLENLEPKEKLSIQVRENWKQVQTFLDEQQIDIDALTRHTVQQTALLDDALDTLLDHGQDFLRIASTFQHSLQLAQPLDPGHETQKHYSTLALLAHRVQTLSTGKLAQYLDSVGSDNSFFLRDSASEADERAQLTELIAYHRSAGHNNIYSILASLQTPKTVGSALPA